MEKLEQIIKPTIGILTNIGTAHDEGFANSQENKRKIKTFEHVQVLMYIKRKY
jgi:alanine racemase